MDGSQSNKIVSSDLTWPNGLTFDFTSRKLYWTDTFQNKIETIKLDVSGHRLRVLQRLTVSAGVDFVSRPYGLTLYKSDLYWTEFISGNIIKHNLDSNVTTVIV